MKMQKFDGKSVEIANFFSLKIAFHGGNINKIIGLGIKHRVNITCILTSLEEVQHWQGHKLNNHPGIVLYPLQ